MPKSFSSHSLYIIGVLSLVLVWSLSYQWGSITSLSTILSFAVGLSSLILSVVAIIQNVVSSSSSQSLSSKLSEASTAISDSTTEVQIATKALKTASDDILAKTSNLDQFPRQLTAIQQGIEQLTNVNSTRSEAIRPTTGISRDSPSGSSYQPFRDIGDRNTVGGITALYICLRSYETGKPIDWERLSPENVEFTYHWRGYIGALRHFLVIDFERVRESERTMFRAADLKGLTRTDLERAISESASKETIRRQNSIVDEYFDEKRRDST